MAQFRSIFHNLNVVITLILNRNIKTMEEHTLKDEYPFCQLQTVLRAYFECQVSLSQRERIKERIKEIMLIKNDQLLNL